MDRERFALRRRLADASARRAWRAASAAAANFAASKRVASARFRACDREVLTRTDSPVGK